VKSNNKGVVEEFRAAYAALRRAGHDESQLAVPYAAVLPRDDLRRPYGCDVWLSRQAAPAASVQFARMRAAWELLPDTTREKAHLLLAIERAR
jgi:hypothetical protein